MPGWAVHRRWGRRLAERLGIDPSLAGEVDRLVDDPRGYVASRSTPDDAVECLEEKGVDARVLAALSYGMIDHDWYTQRLSRAGRRVSNEWIAVLRAVADCLIAPGSGRLAELHVALDVISKLRGLPKTEILQDLLRRGVSKEVLDFIDEFFNDISRSLKRG